MERVPCRIARKLAQSVKLAHGATLWGTSHKTVPDLATFANGALVRYLDFNDTYLAKEPAHPSDNIAAVLAVGEAAGASGQLVIQAIALAYEVQCRLCDAASLRLRGWDHVAYGSFSSALAAAKVMKLYQGQNPPGGQSGRRRQYRLEADTSRRSFHVESLRIFQCGTQRRVCCHVRQARDDGASADLRR